jgi:hypothetical protein
LRTPHLKTGTPRRAIPFAVSPAAASYCASGLVLWHIAAPDVCDGTSAVGESRHRIPGASVDQPTEPCLAAVLNGRAPAAKVTLLENPPSPIGLSCADIANAITRPVRRRQLSVPLRSE